MGFSCKHDRRTHPVPKGEEKRLGINTVSHPLGTRMEHSDVSILDWICIESYGICFRGLLPLTINKVNVAYRLSIGLTCIFVVIENP